MKINHQPEIQHPDPRMSDKNESQDQSNTNNRLLIEDSHLQGGKLESYEMGQREGH
jgi:hypothetical protein